MESYRFGDGDSASATSFGSKMFLNLPSRHQNNCAGWSNNYFVGTLYIQQIRRQFLSNRRAGSTNCCQSWTKQRTFKWSEWWWYTVWSRLRLTNPSCVLKILMLNLELTLGLFHWAFVYFCAYDSRLKRTSELTIFPQSWNSCCFFFFLPREGVWWWIRAGGVFRWRRFFAKTKTSKLFLKCRFRKTVFVEKNYF